MRGVWPSGGGKFGEFFDAALVGFFVAALTESLVRAGKFIGEEAGHGHGEGRFSAR